MTMKGFEKLDGFAAMTEDVKQNASFLGCIREQYKNPHPFVIHGGFIVTALLFSGMHVIARPALDHIPPCTFGAIRVTIALPLLYLITWKEDRVDLSWKDRLWLVAAGIPGIGVGQMLVFVANQMIGAGMIGILFPMAVMFTALLSSALGMEKFGKEKVSGIVLAIAGSAGISIITNTEFHAGDPWGVVLQLIVTASWSVYLIMMSKFLKDKPIPMFAFFQAAVYGFLFMVPFAAAELHKVQWSSIPYSAWLAEAYCGICVTSGAHVLMSWLIHHCPPMMPAIYTCAQPILTVAMATIFLNEKFHALTICCMFAIIGGIGLVIHAKSRETTEVSPPPYSPVRADSSVTVEIPEVKATSQSENDSPATL